MFGMGFMEIFLILVVAIIALGPEKLPNAAVEIARFFKKIKGGVEDAKATLDSELNLSQMKEDANNLKSHLDINKLASLDIDSDAPKSTQEIHKPTIPTSHNEPKKEEQKA